MKPSNGSEKMRDPRARRVFFAFMSALIAVLTALQFVEPYELRMRLVDAVFVGSGVPVCVLLGSAAWRIPRGERMRVANILILGMTIVAFAQTGSRGWWLFWREAGQPGWMRGLHSVWLSATVIGGALIFVAAETIDGVVAPRAWLWWLGSAGIAIAAVLSGVVLIHWYG